jgi:hypothetical protein
MALFGTAPQPEILERVTPKYIADIFREQGFMAEVSTTNSGKQIVKFKAEGLNCNIFFYGEPESGAYDSFQFHCGFRDKLSPEKANDWNRAKRFLKAYSDSDGEMSIEMDIDIEGGVTKKFLEERISQWRLSLGRCVNFLAS